MILADLEPTAHAHEGVEEIHKAALRAADLTRQLLMFSRQQVVAPKVLELNDVLAKMDKMLTRIVGEDVVLVSAPGAGAGRIFADPSNVEQIIMNLVVNARDAMPTGGALTIETANVELARASRSRDRRGAAEVSPIDGKVARGSPRRAGYRARRRGHFFTWLATRKTPIRNIM